MFEITTIKNLFFHQLDQGSLQLQGSPSDHREQRKDWRQQLQLEQLDLQLTAVVVILLPWLLWSSCPCTAAVPAVQQLLQLMEGSLV